MNQKTKTILKIISNALVIVVVVLAFLLHGFQLFGLTPYSVLSGSMKSVYPTGSLIYVAKTDPTNLKVNDVITFKLQGGAVATHRIVELVPDEDDESIIRFRTKGDENNVVDGSLVEFDSVIGSPVFCIPFLGYLASYMAIPSGKLVVLFAAIASILFEIVVGIIADDKKGNTKDNDDNNKENKNTENTPKATS